MSRKTSPCARPTASQSPALVMKIRVRTTFSRRQSSPRRAAPMFFSDSIRPWVWTCIELFGPERCMFASNWPIDNLFTTYPRLLAVFRRLVEDCTADEQEALFARTAERVYRI